MADVLTDSSGVARYFEETLLFTKDAKLAANWVMGEMLRLQKEKNVDLAVLRITPQRLGALLDLIANATISAQAGKKVFDLIEAQDREPGVIIEEQGLRQISDSSALENVVREIIEKCPGEVARFKGGEQKLVGFFVGQAMKATQGKGNPKEINKFVVEYLTR